MLLYRPGPMDYIPQFIARKHGREPIQYDIPVMERYLKDTYGDYRLSGTGDVTFPSAGQFYTRSVGMSFARPWGKRSSKKLNHLKPKFIEGGKGQTGMTPKFWKKYGLTGEKICFIRFQ